MNDSNESCGSCLGIVIAFIIATSLFGPIGFGVVLLMFLASHNRSN